jgi:hypothetical protein
MTELPDDYGSPSMVTRRIAEGLRRKAAEYRKGDKPQRAEGCDEDADALEALLLDYQERGRALERIAGTPLLNDGGAQRRLGQVVTEARATLKGKSQ